MVTTEGGLYAAIAELCRKNELFAERLDAYDELVRVMDAEYAAQMLRFHALDVSRVELWWLCRLVQSIDHGWGRGVRARKKALRREIRAEYRRLDREGWFDYRKRLRR